ncbi:hypothetical protein [Maribacter aestuarii]|uniref:hypothetical protein n=1 Tax=Maribacter aestuarii TaxID=1130723 RepID=UPI0025A5FD04|nr:hypothetical protein [Maribacter aestuarii]
MNEKKTIKVSSKTIKAIITCLVLGLITVFTIEHFGKFSYLEEPSATSQNNNDKVSFTREVSYGAKVSEIYLTTPFGTYLTFDGGEFRVSNMYYSFKKYSNKVQYYFKATLRDFKFIFMIGFGYFVLFLISVNFNFKVE